MERIFFSSVLATWFFIFWLDREMVGFWRFHAADDFLGEFFEHFGNISSIFGRSFDIRHAIFTAILFCFFLCYFTFGFFVRLKQRKKKGEKLNEKNRKDQKKEKAIIGSFLWDFFYKKKNYALMNIFFLVMWVNGEWRSIIWEWIFFFFSKVIFFGWYNFFFFYGWEAW